jgi:hypothetical protein
MIADSRYSRFAGRAGAPPDAERIPPDDGLVASAYRSVLARADRACCCTAKPAVIAIMPPSPTRRKRVELLFCMHHYRASRVGLGEAGALIVGPDGRRLGEVRDRDYPPA